ADPKVSIEELVADPVDVACALPVPGAGHDQIALPPDLFGASRKNSSGLDLSNEALLADLSGALQASVDANWEARPLLASDVMPGQARPVRNPGDRRDVVGMVIEASDENARTAVALAAGNAAEWAAVPPAQRAACLDRAADL